MKTFILVIFVAVLAIDFVAEVMNPKPKAVDIALRGFMILAFCKLVDWFGKTS